MPFGPLYSVRRAGLVDVAGVARLSVFANREADDELPSLKSATELSAPEIALRLLDHLDDGDALYVAERERLAVGFAHVSGLMVGDGGHLIEVRRVYVVPELRRRGLGRQLLRLIQRDLHRRPNPPALRAWAGVGSTTEQFLQAVGATAFRQRWKVGSGGIAVRGVVYGWGSPQAPAARVPAVRKRAFA